MEHLSSLIISIVKLPFIALVKTVVTGLNLIPMNAYEFHGMGGYSATNRPDLREQKSVALGDRVHLGTYLIAYARGAVREKYTGNQQKWKGVWTETYREIQSKWVW
jgi:hypothetical protein